MKDWYAKPAGFPILNGLAGLSFFGVGLFSFYAMGWMYFQSAAAVLAFGSILTVASVAIVKWLGSADLRLPGGEMRAGSVLVAILIAGVLLRVAWVVAVPPVQVSDFKDYTEAARQWLATGTYAYEIRGHILYACRPPGYPMFLVASMAALGDHAWLPTLLNILLYLATAVMAYRIAVAMTGNRQAGLWAALFLSLWPSSIFYTGLAASEPLSLALFTAVFWAFAEADRRAGRAPALVWAAGAGLLIGIGALVKPQMEMLPFLLFLAWLAARDRKAPKAINVLIAIVSMMAAIAPWTLRNYHQFGRFLAISSNGGDVFYRANNPLATGDFTVVGERSLDPYLGDELLWSKTGFAWGKEWIRSHPVDFIKLSVKKVARFLGDDASGAYWTLLRGHAETGARYRAIVFVSNAFWVLIWMSAMAGVFKFKGIMFESERYGLFLWMTLFFVVAHSLFESHSRYHLPMAGFLAVLAAMGLSRSTPEPDPTGNPSPRRGNRAQKAVSPA